jgi:hypothetical protein
MIKTRSALRLGLLERSADGRLALFREPVSRAYWLLRKESDEPPTYSLMRWRRGAVQARAYGRNNVLNLLYAIFDEPDEYVTLTIAERDGEIALSHLDGAAVKIHFARETEHA